MHELSARDLEIRAGKDLVSAAELPANTDQVDPRQEVSGPPLSGQKPVARKVDSFGLRTPLRIRGFGWRRGAFQNKRSHADPFQGRREDKQRRQRPVFQ
jgi:hypothetical protein